MPHFYHKDKHVLVSTNLKVMFSSLMYFSQDVCKSFIRLKTIADFIKNNDTHCLEHYLLVRSPYKKIISFYKQMFLSLYHREVPSGYRHFFPYLGIDAKTDSKVIIKEKVVNTSFSYFISILPKIYIFDTHLIPQHWIMYGYKYIPVTNTQNIQHLIIKRYNGKKLAIFENVNIIKIDDREQLLEFASKIDFDPNIRKCRTEGKINDPELTPDTIKIINKIYKKDFEIFDYLPYTV